MQRHLIVSAIALFVSVAVGCGGKDTASTPAMPDAITTPPVVEMGTDSSEPAAETTPAETTPAEATPPAAEKPAAEKPAEKPAAPAEPSASASAGSSDPNWGTLRGRIVFDGPAPKQAPLAITKDKEFCSIKPPLSEQLVVNGKDGGLANVGVWLYLKRGAKAPTPHPSYAAKLKEPVVLDNLWCRFDPHVAFLTTGQTLRIGNADKVGHNTKADFLNNSPFNEIIPAGGDITKTFSEPERTAVPVSCSIHPWMTGYVIVQSHPYGAVSDADGNFVIENLPVGEWTFQFWQEKSGYLSEVNMGGKNAKWKKGRVKLTIKSGDNNLGEIKVKPALFK